MLLLHLVLAKFKPLTPTHSFKSKMWQYDWTKIPSQKLSTHSSLHCLNQKFNPHYYLPYFTAFRALKAKFVMSHFTGCSPQVQAPDSFSDFNRPDGSSRSFMALRLDVQPNVDTRSVDSVPFGSSFIRVPWTTERPSSKYASSMTMSAQSNEIQWKHFLQKCQFIKWSYLKHCQFSLNLILE